MSLRRQGEGQRADGLSGPGHTFSPRARHEPSLGLGPQSLLVGEHTHISQRYDLGLCQGPAGLGSRGTEAQGEDGWGGGRGHGSGPVMEAGRGF